MFHVREVTADKAYSGKANHWVIHSVGGQAIIPFREGENTPDPDSGHCRWISAKGYPGSASLWRKAWAYFTLHEEEFKRRYRKRNNVEVTFGAIKQRFGERLKSKMPQAQQNEVLCKVIAWNIACVVRAMHEHGVPPDFGAGGENRKS